jgi:hypothetical protein
MMDEEAKEGCLCFQVYWYDVSGVDMNYTWTVTLVFGTKRGCCDGVSVMLRLVYYECEESVEKAYERASKRACNNSPSASQQSTRIDETEKKFSSILVSR